MMKFKMKKSISLLLSLMLIIGVMPFSPLKVFALNQAELFESITEGYDIILENDIYLSTSVVIPAGADVTIDLKGKKLDRGLKSSVENGSVITVEKGGKLKIKDSTGYNGGMITGGASYLGGGICNYGTLIIDGGTISDNVALNDTYGFGGAVYNGDGATLSLKGGVIEYNRARIGAGVYNAKGGTLNVQGVKYEISKGAVKYQIYDNVKIKNNNPKVIGGGIASYGTLNIKDAPVIEDNNDDDLYIPNTNKITIAGALTDERGEKAHVGLKTDETPQAQFTQGFSANNPNNTVDDFFFGDGAFMLSSNLFDGETEAVLKNANKTVVQVFKEGKLTKTEEFDKPQEAWDRAYNYAEASNGYNTNEIGEKYGFFKNGSLFYLDYEGLIEALNNYKFNEICRVEITLGSDWEHDKELSIKKKSSMTIDLNGHYIKRTRNMKQIDNGGVFYVNDNAKLVIKDSKPKARGYDGIRGGVITGGASENTGGAIEMGLDTIVDIEGGTIYECTTCADGGAINMSAGRGIVDLFNNSGLAGRTLIMKNSRIWNCQTVDSTDRCFGGGLYIASNTNVFLDNVTIQDCYSEDSGGGIFMKNDVTFLHMDNVLFTGNTCRDYGGAICVKGSGSKQSEPLGAYNCRFIGNKSEESGGAVYVDGEVKERPTHFSKCTFTNNECGDDGSAVYCNDDNVVLDGCTITNNKAKDKGAVYCDSYYDVNVQGLMTVRDNTAGDTNNQNFVLQDGVATTAYIYSGGLYDGSHIEISSTGGGKVLLSKEMSQYQTQYFYPESGKIEYEHTKDVESKMITASLFNNGSGKVLIVLIAAAALAVVAAIVFKKKRGGADDDDDDEEE